MKKINVILVLLVSFNLYAQQERPELNLAIDGIYKHRTTTVATTKQQTPHGERTSTINSIGVLKYRVIAINDSIYDLETSYEKMSMRADFNVGPSEEYNSEDVSGKNGMSLIFSRLMNRPFNVKLSKSGKVTAITGVDIIIQQALNEFPTLTFDQKQQIFNGLYATINERAMKGSIELITNVFPAFTIKKGDSWKRNSHLSNVLEADLITTYTMADVSDNYYIIKGSSKVLTDKNTLMQAGDLKGQSSLSGTMTLQLKIDRKTGWIIAAEQKADYGGYYINMGDDSVVRDIKIPIKVSLKSAISGN